jgi:hypothetical protein
MRKIMFLVTLLAGLALAVVGFILSAPIGTTTSSVISDPKLPFAPTLFVLGIMLLFFSAVVYELFPD